MISAAISALRDEVISLNADLRAAGELGCEMAPQRLVEIALAETVSHSLRPAGLKLLDLAPPHRRHSPEDLTQGYATRARTWADGSHEKAVA